MKKKNTLYLKRRLKCYSLSPFQRGGIIFNTVNMHLIFLGYFPVHPWGQYLSTLSLGIVLGQLPGECINKYHPKGHYWPLRPIMDYCILYWFWKDVSAHYKVKSTAHPFSWTHKFFQYLCGSKYHKKLSLSRGLKYSKCLGVVGPSLLALTRAEFMQITALLCSAARMQIQEDSDLLQNNLKQK